MALGKVEVENMIVSTSEEPKHGDVPDKAAEPVELNIALPNLLAEPGEDSTTIDDDNNTEDDVASEVDCRSKNDSRSNEFVEVVATCDSFEEGCETMNPMRLGRDSSSPLSDLSTADQADMVNASAVTTNTNFEFVDQHSKDHIQNNTHTIRTAFEYENQEQDNYVRSGTRFRSLLTIAFRKVADGFSARPNDRDTSVIAFRDEAELDWTENFLSRKEAGKEIKTFGGKIIESDERWCKRRRLNLDGHNVPIHRDEQEMVSYPRWGDGRHATELARGKAAEVIALQRALKEAESHSTAISAANDILRDAAAASAARMDRTTRALRISGTTASNARADADAARAKAASFASQFTALKSVMDDVKRTCEVVKAEHNEISTATRTMEERLFQSEAELARMGREKRLICNDRNEAREQLKRVEAVRKTLQVQLQESELEIIKSKKSLSARDAVEQARVDRAHCIEAELRVARAMLVEATSATAETESTTSTLNDFIRELHRKNQALHDKIEENLAKNAKERSRFQDELSATESESQKLRMKVAAEEEEMQRLKLDKAEDEKAITQLKNRILNLERRLSEAFLSGNNLGSPIPATPSPKTKNLINSKRSDHSRVPFLIPQLRPNTANSDGLPSPVVSCKESFIDCGLHTARQTPGTESPSSARCCLCSKEAFGIMKTCQCGNATCDKRAHASCLMENSPHTDTSHLVSAVSRQIIVLCKEA